MAAGMPTTQTNEWLNCKSVLYLFVTMENVFKLANSFNSLAVNVVERVILPEGDMCNRMRLRCVFAALKCAIYF